jgi:hypothetical protein
MHRDRRIEIFYLIPVCLSMERMTRKFPC